MGFFDSAKISSSGMAVQRQMMDVIAENIANINTTKTSKGVPYARKIVQIREKTADSPFSNIFRSKLGGGAEVGSVVEDKVAPKIIYDPNHPDANKDGYVAMPNINISSEMVNLISATRAYEANVTVFNDSKKMAMEALKIGS